jgi:hypothetical protein
MPSCRPPPLLLPLLARAKAPSSSTPSVSAKDVRLFLLLLKKHLPPHDAFVLHKPQISRLDAL